MAGEVAVAVEAAVETLRLPCLARHLNKRHAKTSKAYLHHRLWKKGQGQRHAPNLEGEDGNLHQNQVW